LRAQRPNSIIANEFPELAAGLSERQIAELIEDDEVHAGQMIGGLGQRT
jgi:hypothetical protein